MKYESTQGWILAKRRLFRVLHATKKTFLILLGVFLFLLSAIFVGLQSPFVQTEIAQRATQYITGLTGYDTQIQKVSIDWIDKASLKGVNIKDKSGQVMISAELLTVDLDFLSLLDDYTNIKPDKIKVKNAHLNLVTRNDKMNLLDFIDAFGSDEKKPKTNENATRILIQEIEIDNLSFKYDLADEDSMSAQLFDYNHISLANITGKLQNLKVAGDTTELQIVNLQAIEDNIHVPIKKLTTFFRLTPQELRFAPLDFQFGHSTLRDSVILTFDSMGQFSDFNNQVDLSLNFDESVLTTDDLAIFSASLRPFKENVTIHRGQFKGKVSDFDFQNFDLGTGRKTRIKGNLQMQGLTNIDSTDIILDLKNTHLFLPDFQKYIPKEAQNYTDKLRKISIPQLHFSGRTTDFDIAGRFDTSLGVIQEEFHINIDQELYDGKFNLVNFQLGNLLDLQDAIQTTDIQGKVKGKGFNPDKMHTRLTSKIDKIGLKGYDYHDLSVDATIVNQIVTSDFRVHDPNLKLTAHTEVDLVTEVASLVLDLDTAFLHRLNLSSRPIFAQTAMRASVHRFNLINMDAELTTPSMYLQSGHKGLNINNLSLKIDHTEDGNRAINLSSNLMDAKLYGQFNLKRFVQDNAELVHECLLYVENDEEALRKYYEKKKIYSEEEYKSKSYRADLELLVKDINPVIHLVNPALHLGVNTRLTGHFNYDYRTYATITSMVDTLLYQQSKIFDSNLVVSIGKRQDEQKANIDISLFSNTQDFTESVQTEQLNAEAHVMNQKVVFQTNINDKNSEDHILLNGTLNLLDSSAYRLDLNQSIFALVGQKWTNPDSTQITILGDKIGFKNLSFSNGDHFIGIEGNISEDPTEKLVVTIQDFQIGLFNNLLGTNISGKLNGNATIKNIYHAPIVGSILHLSDFHYEGSEIGNIGSSLTWNNEKKALSVNASLERNDKYVVDLQGDININKNKSLDFSISLSETGLDILHPFTAGNISDLRGSMSGNIDVKGVLSAPILNGKVKLKDAGCRVNMLNTTYAFDDDVIYISENSVEVRNLIIFDQENDLVEVSGGIYHDNFQDFLIDIRGDMDQFQVLNTERSDKEIYYGIANITGKFDVLGSLNDITISADVKTEKETQLYIPLDGYADVEETEGGFIKFVKTEKDKKDALNKADQEKGDLRLHMKFNVDITPDAYCAVIFDESAGDIMRGRAEGSISVDIDTKGGFKMLGKIDIVEGAYNFTFMNLINKEFIVGKGSSITWTGDPFSGILDIKALYRQLTLITPILSNIITDEQSDLLNHPALRKKYEVEVGLLVTGELLSPDIGFSIDILDYPRTISTGNQIIPLGNYIQAFQSHLQSDDQELAKQVFSIIALQRFSAENAFSSMGSSAGGSVSELLSNQLSGWLSQVDERLEIGLDLGSFDSDALKTFQLRFSYSLLGGRMRITRDGGFTNMENQTDPASIIGNWTLEYLLTDDGQFKLKMYHKNSTQTLNSGLRNNSTTGASILMTNSFNSPKELFYGKHKKRKKRPHE